MIRSSIESITEKIFRFDFPISTLNKVEEIVEFRQLRTSFIDIVSKYEFDHTDSPVSI